MKKTTPEKKKEVTACSTKPIDCSNGKPYCEEVSIATCLKLAEGYHPFPGGGDYRVVVWRAKGHGRGGRIIVFFPDNGEKPMVQIQANTPNVKDVIDRFTPDRKSKGVKIFGPLFENGDPTDVLLDICHAYTSGGDISERLSKRIAKASVELDFTWLEGYALAVKLLAEEIKDGPEIEAVKYARVELIKQLPEHVEFVKKIDWANPPHIDHDFLRHLFSEAIKKTNNRPNEITADHFLKAWDTMQRQFIVKMKIWPRTHASHSDNNRPDQIGCFVGKDDVVEIIKSLTEQLIERGAIRPPSKSEVLLGINALLAKRGGTLKSGAKKEVWESSKLRDTLKFLDLNWLPSSRDIAKKD